MKTIPLANGAANSHQEFIVLLGDNILDFTVDYVTSLDAPAWVVNIDMSGVRIVSGAMLEPNADIISHYNLGIGKLIFVGDEVTLDNLGSSNSLVWVSPDE